MRGKYLGLVVLMVLCVNLSAAEHQKLWLDQPEYDSHNSELKYKLTGGGKVRQLRLDTDAMKHLLLAETPQPKAPIARKSAATLRVELPLPDGDNVFVTLVPTDLLPTKLQEKFPSIRSYRVVAQVGSKILAGRVDYTQQGFHAMLLTQRGETILIDPKDIHGGNHYLSYRKSEQQRTKPFQCLISAAHEHPDVNHLSDIQHRTQTLSRHKNDLIEYRLAVAATAEYTLHQGGSVAAALSAITTTISRINLVYEHSLGIRLKLVERNDQLIYTSPATDPYSNFSIDSLLGENQRNVDRVIGNANYDIGHVFGTSGGGLAYIRSVCKDDAKAMAASGINTPSADPFDIDFVAHELGHQLGATHTFNSTLGICTADARTSYSAFEPGSGSSIMSYAGGCATDNLQNNADAMFHSGSIQQIRSNILYGIGRSCGVQHPQDNQPPSVSAGSDYHIPANTPFQLTATATDPDGDDLLYSWEQYNTGTASSLKMDTGDNPLFRIFKPSPDNSRTFPSIKTLTGDGYIAGELLPQTDRIMKFRVAVYDQHHSPSTDQTEITVTNSGGAFKLGTPPAAYQTGRSTRILWNTAQTQYAPINCHTVDLYLSVNNGDNFDYLIAERISNTGSAQIHLPASLPETDAGRFKLVCSDNIFFSISPQSFAISHDELEVRENNLGTQDTAGEQETTLSGGGALSNPIIIALLLLSLLRIYPKRIRKQL
ncbi:MAG: hypothetical protein CSB47_08270 [Proteobacteria bacterium]|nr:MAG: hypothetical protein CSB47_08270 [Pseudomonadota bacterium]